MAAMGKPHADCMERLTSPLIRAVSPAASVRVRLPITIPDYDEPEPDVAVVRPIIERRGSRHPLPEDVLLLIEVAETSHASDRAAKLPIYARAGVPESWPVDLKGGVIERHTEPDRDAGTYRRVDRFGHGDTIASVIQPRIALSVDEILG